jgi:hypothetical protein
MAIIVVAGAAGIVTGTNFLGPAVKGDSPSKSTRPSAAAALVTASDAADQEGLAGRIQIPSVVTLDEFGRGNMTLSVSGPSVEWHISAPGLVVTPSSGTVKEGDSNVVTVRALRVRYWCGAPQAVSAPLTVDGPDDSITATVHWRTC